MQRICPFLAVDDDGRTVVDGFDARHRCRAEERSQPVGRTQQLNTCLEAAHVACARYLAAIQSRGPSAWPPPAPDASFVQTRLVLDVGQAVERLGPAAGITLPGGRWMAGGVLAAAGLAAVASGLAGGLGMAARPAAGTSPTPGVADATATPIAGAAVGGLGSTLPATLAPTSSPRPEPTPTPAASVTATTPSPAPQPRTYVVRSGDSLNTIASRFGTSVQALQEANGLGSSDVILVGQVLVIP